MLNNHKWKEELELIASIINKAPLVKTNKWAGEVFTYNGKNVMSYGGFKNHFALWFNNGVFLTDKYKVLVSANDKTKSLRQWRFTSIDEVNEEQILEYIHEAIEVEKRGLKISSEKFHAVPAPKMLSDALEADQILKRAFEQLTPGKQKEYILYLNEAKQEATKVNRLNKIKPMILNGTGLNDKYKK
jgi:uncharacterized protein YdeI (YjbR/CyaY-like superfamily)